MSFRKKAAPYSFHVAARGGRSRASNAIFPKSARKRADTLGRHAHGLCNASGPACQGDSLWISV